MQTVGQALESLQNLTNAKISQEEFGKALGTGRANISLRIKNKSRLTREEIHKLEKYFNVEYNELHLLTLPESDRLKMMSNVVLLDYYPDVFGSCGTGYFVTSEAKEQIQVPVNALFKKLSKGKKYSVINAIGNSMLPYIEPNDKLIIEHLDNQPIIDNHVYVFCYANDLYIKRLYKNIDEIIAKSDNPDPIFKVKSIPKSEWNNLQIIGEIVGLMRYV